MADAETICASLLERYVGPAVLLFANGDRVEIGAGEWWTAAFGIVISPAGGCVASPAASWKIDGVRNG